MSVDAWRLSYPLHGLQGSIFRLVASKYEEMYAPDIHDFEYITDNAYSKKQILKMEAKILIAAK